VFPRVFLVEVTRRRGAPIRCAKPYGLALKFASKLVLRRLRLRNFARSSPKEKALLADAFVSFGDIKF
jgi:hypothetical protein